jgi:hypothetical protein
MSGAMMHAMLPSMYRKKGNRRASALSGTDGVLRSWGPIDQVGFHRSQVSLRQDGAAVLQQLFGEVACPKIRAFNCVEAKTADMSIEECLYFVSRQEKADVLTLIIRRYRC